MTFSLRTRILAALLILAAVGLAVTDTATSLFLRSFLLQRVDQQLVPRVAAIVNNGGPPLSAPPDSAEFADFVAHMLPPGGFVAVVTPSGDVPFSRSQPYYEQMPTEPRLPDPLPPPVPFHTRIGGLGTGPGDSVEVPAVEPGAADFLIRTAPLPGTPDRLVLGQSLREVDDTMMLLGWIDVGVSLLVLLALVALGLWVVRMGLRPLEQVTATADAIAAGDLSRRVPVPARAEKTEIGHLTATFNAMAERIELAFGAQRASEQRLRRFLADASHELRTPLTSLRGYAELFRRGASTRPRDLAKAMSRIEEEAARMSVLVEDLLLLARLDQGRQGQPRMGVRREEVDLDMLAAAAVEAAQVVEPDRRLAIEHKGPVLVDGDPVQLRQVIDNLLANVRTHTPAGASARVSVRVEDSWAVLEVTDSGPGIPPELAGHVFERFFRTDSGRSRQQGGSGLGLAIVAAIAEAHGGEARVVPGNGNGSGATLQVRLPIAR